MTKKFLSAKEFATHLKENKFTDSEIKKCVEIMLERRTRDRPIKYKKVKTSKNFV